MKMASPLNVAPLKWAPLLNVAPMKSASLLNVAPLKSACQPRNVAAQKSAPLKLASLLNVVFLNEVRFTIRPNVPYIKVHLHTNSGIGGIDGTNR
jgi:hypothetical protein